MQAKKSVVSLNIIYYCGFLDNSSYLCVSYYNNWLFSFWMTSQFLQFLNQNGHDFTWFLLRLLYVQHQIYNKPDIYWPSRWPLVSLVDNNPLSSDPTGPNAEYTATDYNKDSGFYAHFTSHIFLFFLNWRLTMQIFS